MKTDEPIASVPYPGIHFEDGNQGIPSPYLGGEFFDGAFPKFPTEPDRKPSARTDYEIYLRNRLDAIIMELGEIYNLPNWTEKERKKIIKAQARLDEVVYPQ